MKISGYPVGEPYQIEFPSTLRYFCRLSIVEQAGMLPLSYVTSLWRTEEWFAGFWEKGERNIKLRKRGTHRAAIAEEYSAGGQSLVEIDPILL